MSAAEPSAAEPSADIGDAAPPAARRAFVALWPDARVREAIAAEAARWPWPKGAAPVRPDKLHLTLHFLGDLDAARLAAVRRALRDVTRPALVLRLDAAAVWPNGVALLRPRRAPAALRALHAALGEALAAEGLALERRAYRPHVTLARRAHAVAPPVSIEPVEWRAHGFVLAASDAGPPARYVVLDRYEAGAA